MCPVINKKLIDSWNCNWYSTWKLFCQAFVCILFFLKKTFQIFKPESNSTRNRLASIATEKQVILI